MPKVSNEPDKLRPYLFHGVDINRGDNDKEALGTCPWCGRDGKFSVNIDTGLWQCFTCSEQGNVYTFLQKLWEMSVKATLDSELNKLAVDRRVGSKTLTQWGACLSVISDEWLLPGYNHEHKLQQLYKYTETTERKLLMPTPTLGHKLFGVSSSLWKPKAKEVYICEGPWDGMALWEHLASHKQDEQGEITSTSNMKSSLLSSANVIAAPGCTVWVESWEALFADKRVNLMYDNDHPRIHPKTKQTIAPAGYDGMRRVAGILSKSKTPPREVYVLRWSGLQDVEASHDPALPSGYDIRDKLTKA